MNKQQTAFHGLTPETVLTVVEEALGFYLNNLCRPMNSYINRVYELTDEDDNGLIVKFYRPSRWSQQALEDEHDFIRALAGQEVPVIAPLSLKNGRTLGKAGEIFFAVFPKKGGRVMDEYNDDQWLELGHLLGRVHAAGTGLAPQARLTMTPELLTRSHADYLLTHKLVPPDLTDRFNHLIETFINETTPLFKEIQLTPVHGDCHSGNLIYRPGESFLIIDFDDMVIGPPVQDFWMLLPGTVEDSLVEVDIFLEGYRTFHDFDLNTLSLIEPLRAMRFIHYMAWCGHQVVEDGSTLIMPDFGSRQYWDQELADFEDQLTRIREQPDSYFPNG
jgi:Ser/Thr protein kinase RdoA (MazF antagonist)